VPTVADLIVDGLRRAGAARIFGVPGGGSNLDVMAAARRRGLPFVLCHQESAACIMAAVTGELTGQPGVALVGLGAGVTASATGLAHARLDRTPMLLLSDRHPDEGLAFAAHQRLDHAVHLAPVAKGNLTLSPESASHWVAHAVRLALTEPRGPVHIDVPADVAGRPALPAAVDLSPPTLPAPDPADLDRAAELIAGARRPLVVAGVQGRPADARWLRAFCEALPAPVLTTRKAKGLVPDPHPLAMGVAAGGAHEAPLLRRADLIIAFGLDPVELIPGPWPTLAPVLSLARSATAGPALRGPGGGACFEPALEVVGELGAILEELAPRLRRGTATDWDVAEVDRRRRQLRMAVKVEVPGLAPHRVVQIAREAMPAGSIATADTGVHLCAATACWDATELGEFLVSSGLGAMGFGLPAAIAAQLVHPGRRVICFTGRAGLARAATELETAVRLGLPLVVVVFDDCALSPVRIEQEERGPEDAVVRSAGPDLPALARACGAQPGRRPARGSSGLRWRPRWVRAARPSLRPGLTTRAPGARSRPRGAPGQGRQLDPAGMRRRLGYNPLMGFLTARDEQAVTKEFERLSEPVTLTVFASELGPEENGQTVRLLKEVAALSDKLSVQVLNPYIDREPAAAYGVEVTPAIVVEGAKDYGIRFLGLPGGYEFSNLIDSIVAASTGEVALSAETRAALEGLGDKVTIKVFTTPT
jgi:acetolactate synthase-1/2/3 large subunit